MCVSVSVSVCACCGNCNKPRAQATECFPSQGELQRQQDHTLLSLLQTAPKQGEEREQAHLNEKQGINMQAATQQTPFLCPTHTIKRTRMHTKRKNSIKCIPPLLAPAAPHPTFAAISLHGHAGSSSVGGVDAQHPCVEMHRHSWNIKQLAANLHSLEETKCVCVCVCVCLSVFLCTHTHTHTRPLSLSLSLSVARSASCSVFSLVQRKQMPHRLVSLLDGPEVFRRACK